jgi:hypothetical protein
MGLHAFIQDEIEAGVNPQLVPGEKRADAFFYVQFRKEKKGADEVEFGEEDIKRLFLLLVNESRGHDQKAGLHEPGYKFFAEIRRDTEFFTILNFEQSVYYSVTVVFWIN